MGRFRSVNLALAFCLSILFVGPSMAQEQYANVRGQVVDTDDQPLPGVTVTLESPLFAPRSETTFPSGIFRFINVTPGVYTLKCGLQGFKTYLQQNLDLRVGSNFDLKIVMEQAALQEEVTVKAESPIVDTKKTSVGVNVTQVALQEVPSARDPWVILQQAPGILMADENVGGSGSGMQTLFYSKGTDYESAMWNMDGIPITDMTSMGSSFYYDFDSFEEMTITTGGQDATVQTPGVSINFVTRRGGNKFQGMARFYFANDDLQADNRTEELKELGYVGDQIVQMSDYGFQLGGPIFKDRLWFWLGFGVQDGRRLTIDGYPTKYTLYNYNAKLNAQLSSKNRAELALYFPLKYAYGRGAGPFNPPETTLNQKPNGPVYVKLEDEHIFSPDFLLSLKLSYLNSPFELNPQGGLDAQAGYDFVTGMYSGTNSYGFTKRPNFDANLDGNFFSDRLLGGSNELRFGLEYRLSKVQGYIRDPGDVWKYYRNGRPRLGYVERGQNRQAHLDHFSFYLSDSFTTGRLTLNLGLRGDWQKPWIDASPVEASLSAPDFLPALTFLAIDPGFAFFTLSPRIGFTFDLTNDKKTMLRGNIARYSDQMGTFAADLINPAQFAYAGYFWKDLNGDDRVTTNELLGYPLDGLLDWYGFDPWNPTALETPNAIDKNLKSPLTDEILLAVEREMSSDFSLATTLTLRRMHRFTWEVMYDKETDTKITQDDFLGPVTGTLTYDGRTYNYQYWYLDQLRPAGTLMENRPDAHRNNSSVEVTAAKRLSHGWMLNASFTYQWDKFSYGEKGYIDPTNVKINDAFGQGIWMAKLSFLFELPWDIAFSGFANARQGYNLGEQIVVDTPERAKTGLGAYFYLDTVKPGAKRLPGFLNADLSLSKNVRLKGYGSLVLEVDAFNIFNFSHTLGRYNLANSPDYGQITKILNPRVIRLGLRYRF
ncbi:TonB-dependent receptor [bacterium]|nr:MAG: TonB-dependent receptor [bacterium]